MEKELESKIFYIQDYDGSESLKLEVNKYIKVLKEKYTDCIVTKEFFNGKNILVRCVKVNVEQNKTIKSEKQIELNGKERYKEERTISGGGRFR